MSIPIIPIEDLSAFLEHPDNNFQSVPANFDDEHEFAFVAGCRRPFRGQPHTYMGARGNCRLSDKVAFRDIADAVVTELDRYLANPNFDGNVDAAALAGNVCLLLEKVMAIYPNIDGLRPPRK